MEQAAGIRSTSVVVRICYRSQDYLLSFPLLGRGLLLSRCCFLGGGVSQAVELGEPRLEVITGGSLILQTQDKVGKEVGIEHGRPVLSGEGKAVYDPATKPGNESQTDELSLEDG